MYARLRCGGNLPLCVIPLKCIYSKVLSLILLP